MAATTPRSYGARDSGAIHLEYDGKKSIEEILLTPSSTLVRCEETRGDNRLLFAENLGALASLAQEQDIVGQVRLIYIDPPFATQSAFHSRKLAPAYEDMLAGSEFIEFLRERLVWMHKLLADDGSLYLHLDERMIYYIRVILDEIFGASKYRNCITRKKSNPKNSTRNTYGNICDYILFYTKSHQYVWNRPLEPWTEERASKEYQYVEPETNRRYKKVPVHAPEIRYGETGKPWRGKLPPPGKHWQYTPTKLDELDAKGEIYWSPSGNPRRKVYLDDSEGVPVQDIWMDVKDAHNQNIKITGYPTEKNPDILRRIILASSNPGDLVLDAFSGSGTTLAVASELGRRWIGIDNSSEAIRTTLKRLATGLEPMGDYVSRQPQSAGQLRLLDIGGPPVMPPHSPIEDFTVYAELEYFEEITSLLRESS